MMKQSILKLDNNNKYVSGTHITIIEENEIEKVRHKILQIIAIAEDTFAIFDEVACDYVEHLGCEITVDGNLCYKILEPYQEVKDKFVRC